MPHRSRRPPGSLTRDAIVGAALAMADRVGLDGVTIRSLAEALDVPPMTLYSGFSSKSELFDLMYFEVAGRLFANVDRPTWQDALRSVGSNLRQLLSDHPNWAPLFSRPSPPLVSPGREALLRTLQAVGMSPDQAFVVLSTVILSSLGLMLVEFGLRSSSGGNGLAERLEALRGQPEAGLASEQPLTREALLKLESLQLGHLHEQALELVILGCEARLAKNPL